MSRRFVRFFPLLVVAGFVPVVDLLFAAPQERKPRKVAFLVGVGTYDHKFSDLGKSPEKDVTELGKELAAGGFEVHTLLGSKPEASNDRATKSNVEARFKALLTNAAGQKLLKQGDTLVVALCGHGVEGAEPLFCPVDALPNDPTTMVRLNGLIQTADPFGATALFLVDACREDVNRGRNGITGQEAKLSSNTAVLYSCKSGELAHQDAKTGHGVFTYAVLTAIRADEGRNWDRLVAGVKEAFQTDEIRGMIPAGKVQTPVQASGQIGFTALLPKKEVAAKKPADPPAVAVMAKKDVPTDEREESFDYIVNDTEVKKGTRRVLTLDLGSGVTMDVVRITAGEFLMGAPDGEKDAMDREKLQRKVTLTKDFYIGKHEVTQAQYEAILGMNPSSFKGNQLPVETVSWDDATAFCKALGEKVKQKVELPSEAQWEFACRAGTRTPFHFGSKLNGDHANHDGNSPYGTETKGKYHQKTVDVGSYKPNGFGLHDMHGNVCEWCQDYYGSYDKLSSNTNPLQFLKQSEDRHVLRGGSWFSHATSCRAAYRLNYTPVDRYYLVGFRVSVRLD